MVIDELLKEINWSHIEQNKVANLYKELSNKNYDCWHGGEPIRGILFMTKARYPLAMRIYFANNNPRFPYPFLSLFKTIQEDIKFEYTVHGRILNVNRIRNSKSSPICGQVFEFDKQFYANYVLI